MSPEIAPLPRNLRLGDYLIERMLARGGFGFTYLAIREPDMQRVVIKENFPCLGCTREVGQYAFIKPVKGGIAKKGGEEWSTRNFRNEVMALRVLNHPSVAKVLDDFYVPETGTSYYVMPYYPGGALSEALEFGGSVNRDGVLYLAAALMDALEHIHGMGMLHRDVKPQNVVFSAEGVPVLVDFGAARLSDSACPTRIVSDEFAPQEQRKGERQGPWTDIYALGATLYLTITGKHVPDAATRSREIDSYVPLSGQRQLVRLYGFRFLETVDRALSLKPENRYSSVRQWREMLRDEPGFQHETPVRPVSGSLLVEKKNGCVPNTQLIEGPRLAAEAMSQDPGIHDGVPYAEARVRRGRKVALFCVLLALLIGLLGGVLSVVLLPGKTGRSAVAICFATPEQLCEWGAKATSTREAVTLYEKAAEKGNVQALYALGELYHRSDKPEPAKKWYKQASEQGHEGAAARLHEITIESRMKEVRTLQAAGKNEQAAEILKSLADEENGEVQVELGKCYRSGLGVEKNTEEAIRLFRLAVTHGYAEAEEYLTDAEREQKEALIAEKLQQVKVMLAGEKYETLPEMLLPLAETEQNAEAQYYLALCYQRGLGTEKNLAEAEKWAARAEVGQVNDAKKLVDEIKEARSREELEQKLKEARRLNREGMFEQEVDLLLPLAEQGCLEAQMHLVNRYLNGEGVQENSSKALHWLRKAAEQGYAYAQALLGMFSYEGLYGMQKDHEEAVSWFRKAAEAGYADAQFSLASCYFDGDGVMQDSKEGAKWMTRAAEQGHVEAQHQLGLRYMMGKELPQNDVAAEVWLRSAAKKGCVPAQRYLACFNLNRKNYEEGEKWALLAAEQGDLDAMFALGCYYYYTLGDKANKKKGKKLLRNAADQGHEASVRQLKEIP